MSDFSLLLKNYAKSIESEFENAVECFSDSYKSLGEAMLYSLKLKVPKGTTIHK